MNTLLLLIALVPGEDLPPTPRPMPPTPRPAERVFDDYNKAYKDAVSTGRPLLVWVGQRPRAADSGRVCCYQPTFEDGSPYMPSKCVVVAKPGDGTLYWLATLPGTPTNKEIDDALNRVLEPDPKQAGSLPAVPTAPGGSMSKVPARTRLSSNC